MTEQGEVTEAREARFHGLFIGIDRYNSMDINFLKSAVRDATALHAIFTDNLGATRPEGCRLITDEDATSARLRSELNRLQTVSSNEDFVFISFSGHGSTTHELVAYDSDPDNFPGTGIPLDELTELISSIPARYLVLVLDCCFSGGAGAKVLNVPLKARDAMRSADSLLRQMAGSGRFILTASTAEQPAYEDTTLGHGLLTYHFLQALLGPKDVAHGEQINLHDLLQHVTQQVKGRASAASLARQDPTFRGQWDGEIVWPVFTPGQRYRKLHPIPVPVTDDVQSLQSYGIPSLVLDRWKESLDGLNQLQQDAVNKAGLFTGQNILAVSPTSSGKTLIGELAAIRASYNGGRSVFLLPTKALANEQHEKFEQLYGPLGVRVIRVNGDFRDQAKSLLHGQFDIAVLTYEMFGRLALANPHLLHIISLAVIDEVQSVVDPSRGAQLEFLLTLVKSRQSQGIKPQLIALSAVLGDLGGLDTWLGMYSLRSTHRPVPLDEGILEPTGAYRYLDSSGEEHVEQLIPPQWGEAAACTLLVPLVKELTAAGQQVIIIRAIRRDARDTAEYLADTLGLPPAHDVLDTLPSGDPSISSAALRRCLHGGTAFHVSDLDRDERHLIEETFRRADSTIRVIVATTTLAQGVNMPAETVIIPELTRKTGSNSSQPYRVAEYKNIAGRAGRLGLASHGRSVVLTYSQSQAVQIWSQYINGNPENIRSVLLDPHADIYTLVLRVVSEISQQAGSQGLSANEVALFLANSLAAHQNRLAGRDDAFSPASIASALTNLKSEQFITDDDAGMRLTELGQSISTSGLSVGSAIRVAKIFRCMRPQQFNRATVITVAQLTEELEDVILPVNGKNARAEISPLVSQLAKQRTADEVMAELRSAAPKMVASRAKKAVACLLWMNGCPSEKLERTVMHHDRDKNAIGSIRAVASRTHEIIGAVLDIALIIHPTADLSRLASLLPVQLELGIPVEFVPIVLAGAFLTRENYLNLLQVGVETSEQISAADDGTLLSAVGNSHERLRVLRDAVQQVNEANSAPTVNDALPPPTD